MGDKSEQLSGACFHAVGGGTTCPTCSENASPSTPPPLCMAGCRYTLSRGQYHTVNLTTNSFYFTLLFKHPFSKVYMELQTS